MQLRTIVRTKSIKIKKPTAPTTTTKIMQIICVRKFIIFQSDFVRAPQPKRMHVRMFAGIIHYLHLI